MEVLITFLFLFIISCIVFIMYVWIKNTVSKTSPLLISLRQLNQKYHFHNLDSEYTYSIQLSSKAKYDRYNLDKLFEDYLRTQYNYWKSIQQMLEENGALFFTYNNECNSLISNNSKTKHFPIPNTIWSFFELHIFKKEKLSPVIYSQITCYAHYSSPQGRNNYSKSDSYPFSIVDSRYTKILRQQHLEQSIKYQHKKERNRLTPTLRLKIIQRDHYRCKICGRSANDGVKLHVDHIKPIAKGGLTIESNLQTLCEDCNWGKSDKY